MEYVIASYVLGPGILGLFLVLSVVLLGYGLGKLEGK